MCLSDYGYFGVSPGDGIQAFVAFKLAEMLSKRKEGRWVYYRLSTQDYNPYAQPVLKLMEGILDDDPVIAEDKKRLDKVKAVPLAELCGDGRYIFTDKPSKKDK